MKLNFWQILGIILIIGALAAIMYQRMDRRPATPLEPVAPDPTLPMPTTVP